MPLQFHQSRRPCLKLGSRYPFDLRERLRIDKMTPLSPKSTVKAITEKSCGERFLWNRNENLGWIWAGSQYDGLRITIKKRYT